MSDMDIVEVDDENQFHNNKNENHSLSSQTGNLCIKISYHIFKPLSHA